jgi:hypothetical protein
MADGRALPFNPKPCQTLFDVLLIAITWNYEKYHYFLVNSQKSLWFERFL